MKQTYHVSYTLIALLFDFLKILVLASFKAALVEVRLCFNKPFSWFNLEILSCKNPLALWCKENKKKKKKKRGGLKEVKFYHKVTSLSLKRAA